MAYSKDYRIEILLIIPVIWLTSLLFTTGWQEHPVELVGVPPQWDLSKLRVAPPYLDQAEILRSVFEFRQIPINSASGDLLTTIPGIGPVLAERIIDLRQRSGPYQVPADLARVHGIGPARIRSFTPHLRFD